MNSAGGADVLAWLRQQRPRMLEFLEQLTLAESPSAVPDGLRHVRGVLASRLEDIGFATRPTKSLHLLARPRHRRRGRPLQLLIGHYDTVWPLGTLHEMPFGIEGSIVRGPGVFDMKGGLTQMVFALEALAQHGLQPPLTPVILVNADEEIGSRTSTRYITMLARRARRAFVLEPSLGPAGKLKTRRKGIGRFTVTVHGQAAHAGLDPGGGASAILELSYLIQKLFELNDLEKGITVNVGTIDGGLRPNVIAPHSRAVVDVRVATAEDATAVEQAILELQPSTPGVRVHIEGGMGRPALEATPRNQALWQHARRLGQSLGIKLEQATAGGGSDGNTTSLYTATLDGLGPVGDGAHASHEQLDIDRTIERTALLALLLHSEDLTAGTAA